MNKKTALFLIVLLSTAVSPGSRAQAGEALPPNYPSYSVINLSFPAETEPIRIHISREQSLAYHWHAGDAVKVQIVVEMPDGRLMYVRDREGRRSWTVVIRGDLTASLSVLPVQNSFTGRLTVTGNGRLIYVCTPYLSESMGRTLEKVYEARFADGAAVRVHYTDQILRENGVPDSFPKQVLDACVIAYQTITRHEGFSTPGYSLARPDTDYAYDPDKVVDVYLGNSSESNVFSYHGFTSRSFRDAPCFDTVKVSDKAFQSVILLPANYREFIQHWQTLNPSSLGERNINVDLRGTLMHEMLHVVLFYYNRNLNRETGEVANPVDPDKAKLPRQKHLDWYVEGLARYFETFAGAKHDFYSQGFRETLPDKIRFSRGGSNYFMRYPDQPFTDLRYENALFWRFIDHEFGMATIEKISRLFRGVQPEDFSRVLEEATGLAFRDLLKKFALAALMNDFGLKEDAAHLKEIAKTRLAVRDGRFHLLDGHGREKVLGGECATDWVGSWGEVRARFGDLPIAGDATDASDVSGWATDYFEIMLDEAAPELPAIRVLSGGSGKGLLVQTVVQTRGGSSIIREWTAAETMKLGEMVEAEGLTPASVEKVYLLVTNLDPAESADYRIVSST